MSRATYISLIMFLSLDAKSWLSKNSQRDRRVINNDYNDTGSSPKP